MVELLREQAEYQPGEAIAREMHDWLQTEIQTSSNPSNINAYLDDFQKFRANLHLPFYDKRNEDANKALGKYDEFAIGLRVLREKPNAFQDDRFAARQSFYINMMLSGAWRQQCMMQASDGDDYSYRRLHDGPIGIDIAGAVAERMFQLYCSSRPAREEMQQPLITLETLISDSVLTNQARLNSVILLHDHPEDVGSENSQSVDALLMSQRMLAKLAVDHILFAAQERGGDLSKVPSLMPISITSEKQKVYYPFDQA
jgi:hypothetical protein